MELGGGAYIERQIFGYIQSGNDFKLNEDYLPWMSVVARLFDQFLIRVNLPVLVLAR